MPVDRATIEGLLERVKALKYPDAATDCRLMAALVGPEGAYAAVSKFNGAWVVYAGDDHRGFPKNWPAPAGFRQDHEKAFTGSIDAALALVDRVLPGWSIQMWMSEGYKHPGVIMGRSYPTNLRVTIEADTLPLAITAALLQALIAEPSHAE